MKYLFPICIVLFAYMGYAEIKSITPPIRTNEIPRRRLARSGFSGPQNVGPRKSLKKLAFAAVNKSCDGRPLNLPASSDARIRSLAQALDCDWRKCYEYVYNTINFDRFAYIKRGAVRTLLDREGTAADQSILLVALLKASGYNDCSVVYEPLEQDENWDLKSGFCFDVFGEDGKSPEHGAGGWLGLSEHYGFYDVYRALSSLPIEMVWNAGDSSAITMAISHFWVELVIDGETLYLDPTFNIRKSAKSNPVGLLGKLSYNQNTLLSSAGGSVYNNYVKNVSQSAIDTYMNAMVDNLAEVWTNDNFRASDYLGKTEIVPHSGDRYFYGSYLSGGPRKLVDMAAAELDGLRVKLEMSVAGAPFYSFYLDEVDDRNIWLTCSTQGSLVLRCDNSVLASKTYSNGGSVPLTIAVGSSGERSMATTNTYGIAKGDDYVYSLVVNVGTGSRDGVVADAAKRLRDLRAGGAESNSRECIAAALYQHGTDYQAQCEALTEIMATLQGEYAKGYYFVGIAGQADSPYVDMGNGIGFTSSFHSEMLFKSALEHSIGDQLNGRENPSVSTVKMLEVANTAKVPIYYATSGNINSISSSIKNAPEGFVDQLKEDLNASTGAYAVIPQDCHLSVNEWSGYGYVLYDGNACGMIISGGLHGGYCTLPLLLLPDGYLLYSLLLLYQNPSLAREFASDPVSMPDGHFCDLQEDLVLQRAVPLTWERAYNSGDASVGPLGRGWSHNFAARVDETSDASAAFGAASSEALMPTAVACLVVRDLVNGINSTSLTGGARAKRYLTAALVVQWWTRFLAQNAVSVSLGNTAMQFARKHDGSYVGYPGETATLTKDASGRFVLQKRLGSKYDFGADGLLEKITDTSGNEITLTYNDGQLIKVLGPFSASLDIEWADGKIAKVKDSAGRSVSYGYEKGNLTRVTDVCGKNWLYSYDGDGHGLSKKIDPIGNVIVANTYDRFGRVVSQIADNGQIWSIGYAEPWCAWEQNPHGDRLTRFYNSVGRLVAHRDRDGTLTYDSYDGCGNVIEHVDGMGRATRMRYDRHGNHIETISGVGEDASVMSFEYDELSRMKKLIDARGNETKYEYDDKDRLVKKVNADGGYRVNVWAPNGLLLASTDYAENGGELKRMSMTYGEFGLPTRVVTTGVGLPALGISHETVYDNCGRSTSTIDGNGHESVVEYDAAGRVLSRTQADGGKETFEYAANGCLVKSTDAAGFVTMTTPTPSGKVAAIKYADGSVLTNEYDEVDALIASTDRRGSRTEYFRDACGRVTRVATANTSVSTTYDASGAIVDVTNGLGHVETREYDSKGRSVVTYDGLGSANSICYDAGDNPIAYMDPLGRVTFSEYDVLNRRRASVSPMGNREKFIYDGMGNLSVYENAEGNTLRQSLDALGRLLAVTNGNGKETARMAYDGNGNVVTRSVGKGIVLRYAYDACNRLTSIIGGDCDYAYQYDVRGNMVSARGNGVVEAFAYDAFSRKSACTFDDGRARGTVVYLRDRGGLVTNLTYGAGKSVTKVYDEDRRVVAVIDWQGNTWRFAYDRDSKLIRQVSPAGRVTERAYDAAGRLASINIAGVFSRSISRDAAGRRVRDYLEDHHGDAGRTEELRRNEFDMANQLSRSRVSKASGAEMVENYEYDQSGAVVSICGDAAAASLSYTAEGRVSTITDGSDELTFSYNSLGNCVSVNASRWFADPDDPLKRPIVEYDGEGNVVRYYIWAPNQLLGFVDSEGRLTEAYCDDFGSVVGLADMNGQVIYRAEYEPNGLATLEVGALPIPFAWMGGFGVRRFLGLKCLGCVYLTRYRLYSPTLQRFLSPDPMGLAGGSNLYAYGNCNPMEHLDPTGLCSDFLLDSFGGAPNLIKAGFDFSESIATYLSEEAFEWALKYEAANLRAFARGSLDDAVSYAKWSKGIKYGGMALGFGIDAYQIATADTVEDGCKHLFTMSLKLIPDFYLSKLGPGGMVASYVVDQAIDSAGGFIYDRVEPVVEKCVNFVYDDTPCGWLMDRRDQMVTSLYYDVRYGKHSALNEKTSNLIDKYASGDPSIPPEKLARYRSIMDKSNR